MYRPETEGGTALSDNKKYSMLVSNTILFAVSNFGSKLAVPASSSSRLSVME